MNYILSANSWQSLLRRGKSILSVIPSAVTCLPVLLLLIFPAVVQAQFNYSTNDGTITIAGYKGITGPGGDEAASLRQ